MTRTLFAPRIEADAARLRLLLRRELAERDAAVVARAFDEALRDMATARDVASK